MRLTLRTLLAYMDGLLEPSDSQEIGKKIEDSKYATELFHKIRDVMRRLRLAAPSITERTANLDCNTVAEYLDNALPGDRVPDFEEVSLKSEMHLAEVASCHQILTMVLGEPAEIDPESRQRMYQLPTMTNLVDEERLAASEAASMLSGDGNPAAAPPPPVKVRPRPVVPEYLRDPPKKSRLLPAAAMTFLAGAAIALLLLALGQFNAGTPLGNAFQWMQAKVFGKADDKNRDDGDRKKPAKPPGDEVAPSNGSVAANGPAAPATANPLANPGKIEAPVPTIVNPPENSAPGKRPFAIPDKVATAETKSDAKSPVPSVVGPGVKRAEPNTEPVTPAIVSPPAMPPDSGGAKNGPPLAPPVVKPEVKTRVGRFLSDGQDVLLKYEAGDSGWRRVFPEEFLAARQTLLALPSYRPQVVLNASASLELVNGTRIELLADNAEGPAGVDIEFGRVVIKPSANQAGARLRVVVGSHSGVITLTSGESIVGLDVTRVHDPGTDPEKVLSRAQAKLYVARGGAVWEEGEAKQPVRLTAPAELLLDGADAETPLGAPKDLPKWITANIVNELDQRAALSVSQALTADRAASLSLMELTEARQIEIRWLAARCLAYLGQFDPMTSALNDETFRREWPDYMEQLKEAIARGPETAASIRQSLERKYVSDAPALYRMLWGYTDKGLEDGDDAQLVAYLDHEVLAFRVLAFLNLREITHQGLYYRPEATAQKRLQSLQQWQRQQKMGRIRYNPPDAKPRSVPVEHPPKEAVPEPPKPLDEGPPAEAQPTSAIEPTLPSNLGG